MNLQAMEYTSQRPSVRMNIRGPGIKCCSAVDQRRGGELELDQSTYEVFLKVDSTPMSGTSPERKLVERFLRNKAPALLGQRTLMEEFRSIDLISKGNYKR